MKPFLFIIMALGFLTGLGSFAEPERKWLVTDQSRLEISGSSNLSDFSCLNLTYAGSDTLVEERNSSFKGFLLNGLISLEATAFDCRNRLITNDFRKTLKADEYPEIKVRFLCLKVGKNSSDRKTVQGQAEITIAGVTRRYDISSQFIHTGKDKAELKGEKKVHLSDFGLEPRSKMLGMIKVDDTVVVNFRLIIKSV